MGNPYQRSADLALLHPVFRGNVQNVLQALAQQQIPFRVFEAFRYPERQADLYAQGRSKPGNIVTHSMPWRSYHQFGLGADFVLYVNGVWSWDTSTQQHRQWWQSLHQIGAANGLEPLSFEAPHLQLGGTSSDALAAGIYPNGGNDAWAEPLAAVIRGWKGQPAAPPPPPTPQRPPLVVG